MKNEQKFKIKIHTTENQEWQGELQRENNSAQSFSSVIEFLEKINREIEKTEQ